MMKTRAGGYSLCPQCSDQNVSAQPTVQPTHNALPKPLEKENSPSKDWSMHVKFPSEFTAHFIDEDNNIDYEAIESFMDSLNEEQLRIMKDNVNNPETLLKLKMQVQLDVDSSAKALEMES